MEAILSVIDGALKKKRLSDAAASNLAVGNPSLLKNMRNSKGKFAYSAVEKLASVLDLECYLGPPRDLPPTDPASLPPLEPGGDLVQIRLHDQQFAAGDGASVAEAEGVMSSMAFPAPWLHRMGLTARSAALVWVNGDSMEPTLKSGAMAMLDTRVTGVSKRGIYAFRNGKDLFVKRLERIGKDQMIAQSDNPDYEAMSFTGADLEQVKIFGKVVWSGHRIGG